MPIRTPRLEGSLSLTGARIDYLELSDYKVTIDPDSPIVTLLKPSGAEHAYYALYGWSPGRPASTPARVPGPATRLDRRERRGADRDHAGDAALGQRRRA